MSELRSQPVYAVDTPLSALCTAELLVVVCLRLWAAPHRDPDGTHADWRDGLAAASVAASAAPAFDALMRVCLISTTRTLDVRCAPCPHLGAEEGWLLRLVSLLQRHCVAPALASLGEWLPPAAARIALEPAHDFAVALAASGLVVPRRREPAGGVHRIAVACPDPGLTLVQ